MENDKRLQGGGTRGRSRGGLPLLLTSSGVKCQLNKSLRWGQTTWISMIDHAGPGESGWPSPQHISQPVGVAMCSQKTLGERWFPYLLLTQLKGDKMNE